jgi:membrane protease YdiL (CAAX protease family)
VTVKTTAFVQSVLCCVAFTAVLAAASPLKHFFPPQFERYAYGAIGIVVALVVVWLFCKWCKIRRSDIGLQWRPATVRNFITGFIFGVLLSAVAFLIIIQVNDLPVVLIPGQDMGMFFIWAMALLLLSLMEEIGFRTFAFTHLKNNWGVWPAQITIAILFALYHVAGGQDIVTSFLGPGAWAFIFGWAVLRTSGIAMATGIHFAANLVQAAMGQKRDFPAILKIDVADTIAASLQQNIQLTGVMIQVAILITGIVLTWMVTKKGK